MGERFYLGPYELARERVRMTRPPLPGLAQETQAALKLTEDDDG